MMLSFFVHLLIGCSGSKEINLEPSSEPKADTADTALVDGGLAIVPMPEGLIEKAWNIRLYDSIKPYENSDGWVAYAIERDYQKAIQFFDANTDKAALARVHLELSSMYRLALLVHARSSFFMYGDIDMKKGDKASVYAAESTYLFGAAAFVLNKMDVSKKALEPYLQSDNPELKSHASQLIAYIDGDKRKPLELNGFFFDPAGGSANRAPSVGETTHYAFDTATGDFQSASEGFSLWRRARWHEKMALGLLDANQSYVDLWLHPWRLPFETSNSNFDTIILEDSWLFGGFYLVPDDALFLAAARSKGITAISEWSGKSILANALQASVVNGKIETDIVEQQAKKFKEDFLTLLSAKPNQDTGLNKAFPPIVRYAILRAGGIVADANGQYRDAGMLRLGYREAKGMAKDSTTMMEVAAWTAGNKDTERAQKIIHAYSRKYPAFEIARVPLDALHMWRGKNASKTNAAD